MINKWRNKRN